MTPSDELIPHIEEVKVFSLAQMLADDRHPNDYGMQSIAGAVIQCLEQAGW